MKKLFLFLLTFVFTNQAKEAKNNFDPLVLLDQVEAVVYPADKADLGDKGADAFEPDIITTQDVPRRGVMDGKEYLLADLEDEVMFEQMAKNLKMDLGDEEIERHLNKMGMDDEQLSVLSKTWNFSDAADFKGFFKRVNTAGRALSFEVENGLVIPEAEVKKHYDKDKLWSEAEYKIKTASVAAKNDKEKLALDKKLKAFVKTKKGFKPSWDDAFSLKDSEVSAQNSFLKNMKAGDLYVKPASSGFDIFEMVKVNPKHLTPLVERRKGIVEKLKGERYPAAVKKAKKKMRESSKIYYPSKKI